MERLLQSISDDQAVKCRTGIGAIVSGHPAAPSEIAMTPPAHLVLVMLTPQPGREVALGSSRRRTGLAPRGAIEIVPAGVDLFARWFTEKENMLFLFDAARLRDLAAAEADRGDVEFRPPELGTTDEVALQLALMARREIQRGDAANDLCLDSLSLLLSMHLLRTHSSIGPPPTVLSGGLSPRVLRTVSDFIEANLQEGLSVVRLAEVAGLSPGHFLRAFRTSVGQPPHQYVVARRLARAERLIAAGALSLPAIARDAGFCSDSHLAATMKRVRGVTPKEFRRTARRPS